MSGKLRHRAASATENKRPGAAPPRRPQRFVSASSPAIGPAGQSGLGPSSFGATIGWAVPTPGADWRTGDSAPASRVRVPLACSVAPEFPLAPGGGSDGMDPLAGSSSAPQRPLTRGEGPGRDWRHFPLWRALFSSDWLTGAPHASEPRANGRWRRRPGGGARGRAEPGWAAAAGPSQAAVPPLPSGRRRRRRRRLGLG